MTTDRLKRIRLKVKRAKEHILDLDGRIRAFCESKPYTIAAKPHAVPQIEYTTLYVADVQPVPAEIGLIIGDAVHNLRTALDHLAWQLVEAGGGVSNKDTYFPICKSSQHYASAIGKGEIRKMPAAAEKVLSRIQPYITGDKTLFCINELDIMDRHRLLITTASTMDKWGVGSASGGFTMWFNEGGLIPLIPNYEIINLSTSTYSLQQHQNFKLGIEVAFGKPEIVEGKSVLETLNHMADFVDIIVGRFARYLV